MADLETCFDSMSVSNPYDNDITKFISNVENCYQSQVLFRLFSNKSDLYLSDFSETQDELVVEVLGTKRANKRAKYRVCLQQGSFTCNCSDFIYRGSKLGVVCKHICFVVFKVAKILSMSFIETRKMSNCESRRFCEAMRSSVLWQNKEYCVKALNIKFKDFTKEKEDCSCPICFDAIHETDSVSCPECKNYIHEHCMMVWLESCATCVYCRSPSWNDYERI
jgi:hypothetical protein